MLVHDRPTGIGSEAAAVLRAVEGSQGRWACDAVADGGRAGIAARECAVAEAGIHPEDFVVSKAGLEYRLRNDVRRGVERIAGCQAARGDASTGNAATRDCGIGAPAARPSPGYHVGGTISAGD